MARKSRREKTILSGRKPEIINYYLVGFYLRLSDKEIKDGNSESIENQRALLADFIKDKPDFHLVSTFIDDGKTGTNFRRDGFEQLMEEIKKGNINCVIVKDLSRFGRNYLETGHYIEYVFPFLNVRFIAVTDHFDTLTATAAELSYLIPLKNIMNENYARDISKKERSAKKMLRKNGCFLGAYAMYGYEKSTDRHKICIDSEAAEHVKTIFNLCEEGYSDSAIAKYLNTHHVLCPARYKYEKGIVKNEKYAHTSGWYPQTVAGILTSRVYIGDMVQGKRSCREIRGKKEVVPQSQWDVALGTHEAIISAGQFERVQKIRLERHEKYQRMRERQEMQERKTSEDYILKGKIYPVGHPMMHAPGGAGVRRLPNGKVYCGDCKKAMMRKHIKSCKDEYRYVCEVYEKNGQCIRKFMPEQNLYGMLYSLIKKQVEAAADVKAWPSEKQKENKELQEFDEKLREIDDKKSRFLKGKASLYQDWKEGILDRDEYLYMKEHYEQELSRYEEEYNELQKKRQEYIIPCRVPLDGTRQPEGCVLRDARKGITYTNENPALKAVSGMTDDFILRSIQQNVPVTRFVGLSKELVDRLIERIEVFEGNRVRVQFKFQDHWKQLLKIQEADREG